MDVKINGDVAHIVFEEEKNAADVVKGLTAWGMERGFHFFEAEFRGKIYHAPDDPKLQSISIEESGTLHLILAPAVEFALRALEEVHEYIGRLQAALQSQSTFTSVERSHLLDGQRTLLEAVEACDRVLHLGRESTLVAERLRDLEIRLHRLDDEGEVGRVACRNLLQDLEPSLARLLQRTSFAHFRTLLKDITTSTASEFTMTEGLRLLVRLASLLPATAAAIQTGRDGEAMQNLQDLTQAFELTALLFDRLMTLHRIEDPQGVDLTEAVHRRFDQIRAILDRTEQALRDRDISTFGDLVEYELAEQIPPLEALLRELAARFPSPT